MAVVIDNHPSIGPLFSSCVPDWPLPLRVYIPSESEMALPARITDTCVWCSVQLQYTHASGVCDLRVWRPLQTLPCQVSYVYQRVWRWKWFSDQSSYVLQRLRLCRTSDTVFRREIDSRRQWGYGTFHGDSFPRCGGVYFMKWIPRTLKSRKFHENKIVKVIWLVIIACKVFDRTHHVQQIQREESSK